MSGEDDAPPEVTDDEPRPVLPETRLDGPGRTTIDEPGRTTVDGPGRTTIDGPGRTTIDEPRQDSVPAPSPRDAGGPVFSRNLPPELAVDYRIERELPTHGAEADLLVVREINSGELRVAKIYRRSARHVDREMLSRVRSADAAHVVGLHAAGGWDANPWELLEFCERGSLAELITAEGPRLAPPLVREIFDELAGAIEHVHSLGVVHRDLKPANVLVRTRSPLDLVLADFGLATVLGQTREMRTGSRTVEYAAPEAAAGLVTNARDWWSLGIILLEILIGRHPFTRPDGTPFEPRHVEALLATESIDVSGIADPDLRLLVSGLLVRDPKHRWGAPEIGRWRAGDPPAVHADEPPSSRARRVKPFGFRSPQTRRIEQYTDPRALAEAFAVDWEGALEAIQNTSSNRRTYRALNAFFESAGVSEAAEALSRGDDPDLMIVRILAAAHPQITPRFRGRVIERDGLLALAASAREKPADAEVLDAIYDLGILREYAGLRHDTATYGELDSAWSESLSAFEEGLADNAGRLPGVDLQPLVQDGRAAILEALLDEGCRRHLASETTAALGSPDTDVAWFRALGAWGTSETRIARSLLVLHLRAVAAEEVRVEREAVAEAERAEREAAVREATDRRRRLRSRYTGEIQIQTVVLTMFFGLVLGIVYGGAQALSFSVTDATGLGQAGPLASGRYVFDELWPTVAVAAGGTWLIGQIMNLVTVAGGQATAFWSARLLRVVGRGLLLGILSFAWMTLGLDVGDITNAYVPRAIWPVVVGAMTAGVVVSMLAALLRGSSWGGGARTARVLGYVLGALVVLGAGSAAARIEPRAEPAFTAASVRLAAAVPATGCRPAPYEGDERPRDWIIGEARCVMRDREATYTWTRNRRGQAALARRRAVARTHPGLSAGACTAGGNHQEAWAFGEVLCYRRGGHAWLEASDERTAIYTTLRARRDGDGGALATWWRAHRATHAPPR